MIASATETQPAALAGLPVSTTGSPLTELGRAAVGYASRGWWVFPLQPRSKAPLTFRGVKDASRDLSVVEAWWREWPDSNIGLDCGRSGLPTIDLDKNKQGLETWAQLCTEYGIDPEGTLLQRTGTDGRHLLYAVPVGVEVRNRAEKLGPGIDTRGINGYIVLAPSVHPNGQLYKWLNKLEPAILPNAIVEALRPKLPTVALLASAGVVDASRAYERCLSYLACMPNAISGSGGHNITWRAACEAARFGLSQSDAWNALQWFNASKCKPAWSEVELRHKLEDAYDDVTAEGEIGMHLTESKNTTWHESPEPSQVFNPPVEASPLPASGAAVQPSNGHRPATVEAADASTEKPRVPTDDELRDRVRGIWPNLAFGMGQFRNYEQGVYTVQPSEVVHLQVSRVLEAAKAEGVRPTSSHISSVVDMLRYRVFAAPDLWDANADLLPCRNGALHIPTRELRPHSPDNFFTSALPYDFDPAAVAHTWLWFINDVVAEASGFLQEFAGYALTTSTRYELALWLHGQPGGGKSTFITGLQAMLGERAGLLSLADIQRSRFALADLPGKTLAISTEQPRDYIASTGTLNAIISGESLTVEQKFKAAIKIVPRAKLAWAMNSLPRVTDNDSGLFRRVRVVTFPTIPTNRRDPQVKELIATEGAGILNWALEGLDRLNARGRFEVPACVQQATEQFRETNDIPAQFVAECCQVGTDLKVKAGQLYRVYQEWCKDTGHKAQSMTTVAADWDRLGFEKSKADGNVIRHGLTLRPVAIFGVDTVDT